LSGPSRAQAESVLQQFCDHPQAWTRVDAILSASQSSSGNAKFVAVQVLLELVKKRWKTLPREQCEGLKNYVVNYIIASSSDAASLQANRMLLTKLNATLVQIIKQDWPRHWQGFIPEIVSASKTNESLAANNMSILMMLSEEVFDFARGSLTQAKTRELKAQFTHEFGLVFELCQFIMQHSMQPLLVQSTLKTLQRFLSWIPAGFVFETDLVEQLISKFLPVPMLCNDTIKCLTEIVGLDVGGEVGDDKFRYIYTAFMSIVAGQIGDADIAQLHFDGTMEEQAFIADLALFLTTFFREHRAALETPDALPLLSEGHVCLSRIGLVEDLEVFKICLDYWHVLSEQLYQSRRHLTGGAAAATTSAPLLVGSRAAGGAGVPPPYDQILSTVRLIMIQRMAKPEEVLLVKDPDSGEYVRESVPDSEARTLYKQMRETLVFLTHLDADDTHIQMLSKLQKQVDNSEWAHDKLNTLCWAIGSISGACNDESEKRFLVTVIKDLLGLVEMKRGKDHKAVVASNIMYVVGQYPAFLRQHWKFLKTVINKLFEFMHETHPGVQDMAVDTFLTIARNCKRKFVVQQPNETGAFVDAILDRLSTVVSDLSNEQIEVFYEAVATLIGSHTNAQTRNQLTARLMQQPNATWQQIMAEAAANVQALCSVESLQALIAIVKLNYRATLALGHAVTEQLGAIFLDLLNVYRFYAQCVSQAMGGDNRYAGEVLVVRLQRQANTWILRLLAAYVERCTDRGLLRASFLPPLLDAVLGEFGNSVAAARDAWALTLMTTVIDKLGDEAQGDVNGILGRIFEPTLTMITDDFTNHPVVRLEFFKLLRSIETNCFAALFALPPDSLKLIVDALVYGMRHTDRAISEMALNAILELVFHVTKHQRESAAFAEGAQSFWQRFVVSLLQDVLVVLTDTLHKSGFKYQTAVLRSLIGVVESGLVVVPLMPGEQQPDEPNNVFLRRFMAQSFAASFEQLTPHQITEIVNNLFGLHEDLQQFKATLRDFLVQLKSFSTAANEELYIEEKENADEARKRELAERDQTVPGLLRGIVLPDEDLDNE
jgi:exportin-1